MDKIFQIKKDAFVQIEVKKSKFLCFSFAIGCKEQAEDILESLKNKYSDATHVCHAYIVNGQEKYSDDGEPQYTAGKPILDCIKRKNLKNVLVAVVRYFGGVKLGAGGLIRAYANCAKKVLDESGTKEQIACKKITFDVELGEQKKLKLLLNNSIIKKSDIKYQNSIIVSVYILPEKHDEFIKILNDCFKKTMSIIIDEELFYI